MLLEELASTIFCLYVRSDATEPSNAGSALWEVEGSVRSGSAVGAFLTGNERELQGGEGGVNPQAIQATCVMGAWLATGLQLPKQHVLPETVDDSNVLL